MPASRAKDGSPGRTPLPAYTQFHSLTVVQKEKERFLHFASSNGWEEAKQWNRSKDKLCCGNYAFSRYHPVSESDGSGHLDLARVIRLIRRNPEREGRGICVGCAE